MFADPVAENNAKAHADAREAVKLDPTNVKAHHRGILGALGRARFEDAIAQCEAALKVLGLICWLPAVC